MNNEIETALKLAEEIAQDRAKLKQKEEKFAALFGRRGVTSYESNGTVERLQIDVAPEAESSVADRIRYFFRSNPGKVIEISAAREALPDVAATLVRSTVNRLAGDKYGMPGLKSVGRGRYRYKPQEPESTGDASPLFGGVGRKVATL